MELHIHGHILSVRQLGSEMLIADTVATYPPGVGTLHVTIDGSRREGPVELPDGISPDRVWTRIVKPCAVKMVA
jgi:hypothetical protein